MSKSNFFGPGANDVLNGTTIQFTSLFAKPSCFATAYATALSKPWPERGSLTFHGDFSLPPNHGGYAGLSVPTVSCAEWTSGREAFAQVPAPRLLPPPPRHLVPRPPPPPSPQPR